MARILIVDDSIAMRAKLKSMLTQAGHSVVAEAANGMQAYKEYEKHLPDLVTMDITMPIVDGIASLKRILEVFPYANIIMVSSLAQKHMILSALESGAKHYIIKPIDYENLSKVINQVLDESNMEKKSAGSSPSRHSKKAHVQESPTNSLNQAFSIENKNGTFIINISNRINPDNTMFLNSAVQGLLFVKPLITVFNFENVDANDKEVLEILTNIMEQIVKSDGKLNIVSSNKQIVEFVKSKNLGRWNNIFSNISEVPF